ncbi:hypothetical protein [Delftia tsuruhatensis]|uniref:hypothetical protein n=1 Tax=Delftia tsuruhatensis TaxID=180282 RepID=UPI000772EC2D|nr:hypothetical protein [Delftia tsuruhatensis]SFB53614.1 hypothetical protein SAMN05444579_108250 [Delftia tsuruhatensis]
MQCSSTADSAHVCTLFLAVDTMPLQRQIQELERLLWPYQLTSMCNAATARVQQGILQAASEAYIALDIPPPDSHVIDVLMSIPGLAGVELTDDARGE